MLILFSSLALLWYPFDHGVFKTYFLYGFCVCAASIFFDDGELEETAFCIHGSPKNFSGADFAADRRFSMLYPGVSGNQDEIPEIRTLGGGGGQCDGTSHT